MTMDSNDISRHMLPGVGLGHTVSVPKWLPERMLEFAGKEPDREVCGLVFSKGGRVTRLVPVPNKSSTADFFHMEEDHLVAALSSMEMRREEIFGIYHSHPNGPGEPSSTDIQFAMLPALYFVIVPGRNGVSGEVRAWRIAAHCYSDKVVREGVVRVAEEVEILEYLQCMECGGIVYA